jgi:hypothetical protein
MLAVVGYSQSVVQVVSQVDRIKLVGDGVSFASSGKTITDHALSAVAGADCKIFNVFSRNPVCAARAADAKVESSPRPAAEALPQPATLATLEVDVEDTEQQPELSAGAE